MTPGCLSREEGGGYPFGKRQKSIFEKAGFNKSRYSHIEFKEPVEHSVDIEEMAGNEGPDLSREAWMVV